VNDLGKFAVIGAIMGALLLVGLLLQPSTTTVSETAPVAATPAVATPTVTVVASKSLEMLDPVYSEKAVFQDSTIRVSFDVSQDDKGVETRLPFWLHNVSHGVINVLWDRCSIQLPDGNTVSVMSEEGLKYGTGSAISIASAGDLFDAMVPMSAVTWGETGYEFSYGVLDQGIFTVVLAIERDKVTEAEACVKQAPAPTDGCAPQGASAAPEKVEVRTPCATDRASDREVAYYTFRFIIR
jgi:hypothetical protein